MRRTAVLRWDCSMWSSGCWANLSLYYPPHCNPPRELPLAHSHHFPRTSQTAVLGPPSNLSHCPYLSRRRQWHVTMSCFFFGCIYFWSCWVFVAVHGLSLVATSRGYSWLPCVGVSLRRLLLLWSTGSRLSGFSTCGTWAQSLARGL